MKCSRLAEIRGAHFFVLVQLRHRAVRYQPSLRKHAAVVGNRQRLSHIWLNRQPGNAQTVDVAYDTKVFLCDAFNSFNILNNLKAKLNQPPACCPP